MKKERIAKLVHAIVGRYIQQHLSPATMQGVMATVTEVMVTPKGDMAKVYCSFVGPEGVAQEKLLKNFIIPHAWLIRKEVAEKLRNLTHTVPKEIRFYVDPTPAKAAALEAIIAKVNQ